MRMGGCGGYMCRCEDGRMWWLGGLCAGVRVCRWEDVVGIGAGVRV